MLEMELLLYAPLAPVSRLKGIIKRMNVREQGMQYCSSREFIFKELIHKKVLSPKLSEKIIEIEEDDPQWKNFIFLMHSIIGYIGRKLGFESKIIKTVRNKDKCINYPKKLSSTKCWCAGSMNM
ncbi:hypothetical protein J437_LFUL002172 [Ladona fulva]|uniref:Uncharacterized protein n=1 Tax=Ladona fulva TaxID=123851 RepID=A0A8K0JTJ0_LADFU|nr:hypothetical protein J437_LFUL002172 [Ladona fulva]